MFTKMIIRIRATNNRIISRLINMIDKISKNLNLIKIIKININLDINKRRIKIHISKLSNKFTERND